jgi:hypothetical protein
VQARIDGHSTPAQHNNDGEFSAAKSGRTNGK